MTKKISQANETRVDILNVDQKFLDNYKKMNVKEARKAIQTYDVDELLVVALHELKSANELQSEYRRSVRRAAFTKLSKHPQAVTVRQEYQREAEKGFTILQVGQTGSGKSSTINSLFGEEVATTNKFDSETRSVTPYEGRYNKVKYTIYDTPGLGERGNKDEEYLSLMKEQCSLPDVLWYVLRLDRHITAADVDYLNLIHQNFDDAIWDRTMIVFTHADRISSEDFQAQYRHKTKVVNEEIVRITNRENQGIPAVNVANGYKHTPDGKSWLGGLFVTSLERLNPDHRTAFLLAFIMDLKIPKPKPPEPKVQNPEPKVQNPKANNSEEGTENKGRIDLTEDERNRVLNSKGVSNSLLGGLKVVWTGIGATIDILSGGLTFGIPTVIGAIADFVRSWWD